MQTPEACAARVREIYGADVDGDGGVIHVTAVWQESDSKLWTIRIGPASPKSETDFFLLNLARARADAIVTSGRILREEPELRHELQGDWAPALAAWRAERLRKPEPARSVVLTGGRGLDFGHPLLRAGALVVTSFDAASALAREAAAAGVELAGRPQPGLRDTVSLLRSELGLATLAIEAGPTASAELYAAPLLLDELMLSVFEEPELAPALRGGPFPGPLRPEELLPLASPPFESREASGRWRFRRYRRFAAPPARR